MQEFYRFRPGWSWIEHVWKSTVLQDHDALAPLLRPVLPADGVAVDIGAHGGQVARLLADLAPRGRVIAVEPSGYARSVLRSALLLRPRRNVEVVACALGPVPGLAVLATPLKRGGTMGYGTASLAPDPARRAVREVVPVATLDALAEALALPRLDLIKLDVEGHEAAVLAGAAGVLARWRPAILVEVAGDRLRRAGASPEALFALLEAAGYAGEAVGAVLPRGADGDWLFRVPA